MLKPRNFQSELLACCRDVSGSTRAGSSAASVESFESTVWIVWTERTLCRVPSRVSCLKYRYHSNTQTPRSPSLKHPSLEMPIFRPACSFSERLLSQTRLRASPFARRSTDHPRNENNGRDSSGIHACVVASRDNPFVMCFCTADG